MNKTLIAIVAVATVLGCVLTNPLGGVLAGVLAWLMVQFRYFDSNFTTATHSEKVFAVVLAVSYVAVALTFLLTGHWLALYTVLVCVSALFSHVIVGIVRKLSGR